MHQVYEQFACVLQVSPSQRREQRTYQYLPTGIGVCSFVPAQSYLRYKISPEKPLIGYQKYYVAPMHLYKAQNT